MLARARNLYAGALKKLRGLEVNSSMSRMSLIKSLWYDTSYCRGSLFLHELERSTEMVKIAYFSFRLRKPQVWNHQQERSNQTDALNLL